MVDRELVHESAVDWREAHRQLVRIAHRRAALDAEEARWLVIAEREQVHVELGFGSFLEYVERILGHRPRTAIDRLRVARALEDLPETREMLASGDVTYSAVREITRVVTPETERAWLDAIDGKTMRQVEDIVAGHAVGDLPDDPADPALEPRRWTVELPPDVYALLLETRRRIEEEMGGSVDDAAFVAALCERASGTASTACNATGTDTRADTAVVLDRAPYQIALTICERCDRATQDGAGHVIAVAPEVVDRARCDAEYIGRLDAATPARITTDIPPATRRHVLRRDHGRCAVPGCRVSKHLQIHHIVPREAGGDHALANLTLLCGPHHRALHAGRVRIHGRAPDALVVEHVDGHVYGARAHVGTDAPIDGRRRHVHT